MCGGKITKFTNDDDCLTKWTCNFCFETRKGWNATKALGSMIGVANNVKGCEMIPPNGSSCILILSRGRSSQNKKSKITFTKWIYPSITRKWMHRNMFEPKRKLVSFVVSLDLCILLFQQILWIRGRCFYTYIRLFEIDNEDCPDETFSEGYFNWWWNYFSFSFILKHQLLFLNPCSDAKWKQKVYLWQNIFMTMCGNPQAETNFTLLLLTGLLLIVPPFLR